MVNNRSRKFIAVIVLVCVLPCILWQHVDLLFFSRVHAVSESSETESGRYVIQQSKRYAIDGKVEWKNPDDTIFFVNPATYSSELAGLSAIMSMLCYSSEPGKPSVVIDGDGKEHDILDFMGMLGFSDAEDINVPRNPDNADFNRTEIFVAHKKVKKDDEEKEILAVMIRGTNGTMQEWMSNFYMGSDADDGTDRENHAGFEISSEKVLEEVKEYTKRHELKNVSYWLSGHSRGAALANL